MDYLLSLTAKKVKTKKGMETHLFYDGKLKAVIPTTSKQPRRDKKTITLNCWKYRLIWAN